MISVKFKENRCITTSTPKKRTSVATTSESVVSHPIDGATYLKTENVDLQFVFRFLIKNKPRVICAKFEANVLSGIIWVNHCL